MRGRDLMDLSACFCALVCGAPSGPPRLGPVDQDELLEQYADALFERRGDAEAIVKPPPLLELARPDARTGAHALHLACLYGLDRTVDLLLSRGAPVDVDTCSELTPLHLAATSGSPVMLRSLLARGARWFERDSMGQTAVHLAVMAGSVDSLRVLAAEDQLAAPARALVDDFGWTPHHRAALMGDRDCLVVLCERFPEHVNTPNPVGRVPLHYACLRDDTPLVEALLEAGAEVGMRDALGHAPFDYYLRPSTEPDADLERRIDGLLQEDPEALVTVHVQRTGYDPGRYALFSFDRSGLVLSRLRPSRGLVGPLRAGIVSEEALEVLLTEVRATGFLDAPPLGGLEPIHGVTTRILVRTPDARLAREWEGGDVLDSGPALGRPSDAAFPLVWKQVLALLSLSEPRARIELVGAR